MSSETLKLKHYEEDSERVMMAIAGCRQIAATQRYIDLRQSADRAAVELVEEAALSGRV